MLKVDAGAAEPLFQRIADRTFEYLGLSGDAVVEVDFLSEEEIRAVNKQMRAVDRETDVLSFPLVDELAAFGETAPFTKENYPLEYCGEIGGVDLGNVLICQSVAKRQAEEYGHGELRERGFLFLHGLLHLLGFDHETEEQRTAMRKAEEDILSAAGLNR